MLLCLLLLFQLYDYSFHLYAIMNEWMNDGVSVGYKGGIYAVVI